MKEMKKFAKVGTAGLLLGLILQLAPGCSGGGLKVVQKGELNGVRRATVSALQEMNLRPHELESDAFSALIIGEVNVGVIPQDRELRIRLKKISETETQINMRILFTRDQKKLELILEKIKAHLKKKS